MDTGHAAAPGRTHGSTDAAAYPVGVTQDHVNSIFARVEVRSRRELVVQLFVQQCAPRMAAGAPRRVDGWFAAADAGDSQPC
jgi:hypothetical protein